MGNRMPNRESSSLVIVPTACSQFLCPNHLTAIPADNSHCIVRSDLRKIADVHQQLVHAHPPHHRTTPALNQHLAAPLRQIPGQTVRVADGDHRQFGFLLCLKDPPVPGALSGLHSADTGHSGPERQNRPQVKASLNRRIIASNSIECDSSPDIVTGLSWRFQSP